MSRDVQMLSGSLSMCLLGVFLFQIAPLLNSPPQKKGQSDFGTKKGICEKDTVASPPPTGSSLKTIFLQNWRYMFL